MTGECTGGIVICITVGIWTVLFEDRWIVHSPMRAFACLWGVECSTTAVFVSVECQTGTFASGSVSIWSYCQFVWTMGVYVSVTSGSITVVVAV